MIDLDGSPLPADGRVCPICGGKLMHKRLDATTRPNGFTDWVIVWCENECIGPVHMGLPIVHEPTEEWFYIDFAEKYAANFIDTLQRSLIRKVTPTLYNLLWDSERHCMRYQEEIRWDEAFEIALRRMKENNIDVKWKGKVNDDDIYDRLA